jgi:hypothetical protein
MPINAYVDGIGFQIICGARVAEICEAEGYRKIPDLDTLRSDLHIAPFVRFDYKQWPLIMKMCE